MASRRVDGRSWTDGRDGHPAAGRRLLATVAARRLRGVVMLSGDVHAHHVAELRVDADEARGGGGQRVLHYLDQQSQRRAGHTRRGLGRSGLDRALARRHRLWRAARTQALFAPLRGPAGLRPHGA
ncbi:MAG: alkaline phosphatase D family protein [Burkholderiales bacterium]|nr:alkaline phosphatase D family protein [Burkholderiales bacterium]